MLPLVRLPRRLANEVVEWPRVEAVMYYPEIPTDIEGFKERSGVVRRRNDAGGQCERLFHALADERRKEPLAMFARIAFVDDPDGGDAGPRRGLHQWEHGQRVGDDHLGAVFAKKLAGGELSRFIFARRPQAIGIAPRDRRLANVDG